MEDKKEELLSEIETLQNLDNKILELDKEIEFFKKVIHENHNVSNLKIDFSEMLFKVYFEDLKILNSITIKKLSFLPFVGLFLFHIEYQENFYSLGSEVLSQHVSTALKFLLLPSVIFSPIILLVFNFLPLVDKFIGRKITTKKILKRIAYESDREYKEVFDIFTKYLENENKK